MRRIASAIMSSPAANTRLLFSHPAHLIALGFGTGLAPFAPGTVATLWAWAAFVVLQPWMNDARWALLIGALLPLACWASAQTAGRMQQADPSAVVIDEIVAFWIVLWLVTPAGFWWQLGAFALFRFFDAAKPGPVGWADRHFKGFGLRGGFGIVFDDLVAAGCTLLVIALLRF